MIKAIVIATILAVCGASQLLPFRSGVAVAPIAGGPAFLEGSGRPEPFQFGFNAADEFGTQWSRQESSDANGVVKGSYGYRDGQGIYRTVEYVADDVNGFRANVRSNEPGLISSNPADVIYNVGNRK